ncbi:MAG TPA: ribonuclease III [Ktedonobacterales bacterium]|nr:ribonuclease III [Ktedonobacterales bacterium]
MADPPNATSNAHAADDAPTSPPAESGGPGDGLEALRRGIGHTFARPDLLLDALTHRSFVHEFAAPGVVSNERLEFLGDAALALVSADYLYRAAPEATEGDLTAVRAALVRASTLAMLARQLRLGRYLRLGRGEEATGGRQRDLLLASAFEAVLGALFLDGGLAAVRALLEPRLAPLARDLIASGRVKDDKSLLQEQAQAQLGITPTYHVVEATGPSHQPSFAVEVRLGERVVGRGAGRNKRLAEQAAAHEALDDPGWLRGDA